MNNFYIYLHIRLDKDIPFYVGKGKDNRAFQKRSRNQYWHNIVNAYGYRVEIIEKNLSKDEANKLECQVIKSYRDSGIRLSNMTDGGDGRSNYKWTKESIEKRTKSVLGKSRANKGHKWETFERIRFSKLMTGKKHIDSKTVIDPNTGITYRTAKEAGLTLNIPWRSLYKMLNGERPNTTSLKYLER